MKRRKFIKNISQLSSTPLLLNGVGLSPFATEQMLNFFTTCDGVGERSLVVLFLKGGNDGLNTIIPVDQYDIYVGHRPNIAIPDTGTGAYINLDTGLDIPDQVGIHPIMTSLKDMYDAGNARLIQAVGYPTFDQSHFKSTDFWLSGKDGTNGGATTSGWAGRFFETAYPGIHNNPDSNFPDPLGIQFGDIKASLSFHDCSSIYEAVNLTNQDPGNLFGLLNGLGTEPHEVVPATEYGAEIDYIMDVENSTNVYGERITNVYNAGSNSSTTYPDTYLGGQLKTIARLLSGGSQTKVFLAHQGGFDTHANQVVGGSTHTGNHANLLENVFDSIKAFHDDLNNLGHGDKVVTVVFSEFSRRITENGSSGTDHGNYGPMFLFGNAVEAGITGTNFDLNNISSSGNMDASEMQYDYRDVFKTLLQNWLGAGEDILDPIDFGPYAILDNLITPDQVVDPSCYINPEGGLPVELVSFTAKLFENESNDKQVNLEWITAQERNSAYFEIERRSESSDSVTVIAQVEANGFSSFEQRYEALDIQPLSGTSYYRLKIVDQDGTYEYSDWKVIELASDEINQVKLYPNPAKYDFNLVMTTTRASNGTLQIYDLSGKMVYQQILEVQRGFNKFNIDASRFAPGQYTVHLIGDQLSTNPINLIILD